MFQQNLTNIVKCTARLNPGIRSITTSLIRNLDQKWRQERGLPLNPNAYGVLTDGPDYTYLDGRPTAYGVRQKKRIFHQREIAQKIIRLTKEVDFAVANHQRLKKEEHDARRRIIENKLQPKGVLLLKK